jgi:hypothetical protein
MTNTIRTQYDCASITLYDGSTPRLQHVLHLDRGDFSADNLQPGQRAVEAYQRRGKLQSLRKGEKAFPTGSMSAMMAAFTDATDGTVFDFLYGAAPYAARRSTTEQTGDLVTFDIVLRIPSGLGTDHVLEFKNCHITGGFAEGSPDVIDLSWTCYGEISLDGQVQSTTTDPLVAITPAMMSQATAIPDTAGSDLTAITDDGDGYTLSCDSSSGSSAFFDLLNLAHLVDEDGEVVFIVRQSTAPLSVGVLVWDGVEASVPSTLYRPTTTGLVGRYLLSVSSGEFALAVQAPGPASGTTSTLDYSHHVCRAVPDGSGERTSGMVLLALADGAIPPDGSSRPGLDPVRSGSYDLAGDRATSAARTAAGTLRPGIWIIRDGAGSDPLNVWIEPPEARGKKRYAG